MQRLTFILFGLALLAIAGGTAWYLMDSMKDARRTEPMATSTPEVSMGQAIYTNGPYGFTMFYPENATVNYGFETSYHLPSVWRANALASTQGNSIVEIVPYTRTSENSYPRYFTAMVRVGASTDPDELAACERATSDQGEVALPDVVINGTTWKAFSFENAGMMQYVRGVSYRTLHEGACIALERIQVGSSYRDVPSEQDIPDTELQAAYESLTPLIESFSFVER